MFKFIDEDSAREQIEKIRWPNGAICPKCGHNKVYKLMPRAASTRPVRKGVYKCAACRKQFTCTVGTIFEDSHIPLCKWLMAIHLLCASKKGMSAHQLHRMLGLNYRSAWFMAHRIRYAMSQPPLREKLKGIVEADETYFGGRRPMRRKMSNKSAVFALVQRQGGVKSYAFAKLSGGKVAQAIREHLDMESHLMTDKSPLYKGIGREVGRHDRIRHDSGEYVRGNVHTNTVEGYFSLLKRGVTGVYHHVGRQHLQRYLDEFNFRYNTRKETDMARAIMTVQVSEGKRLTYKQPIGNP